MNLILLLAGASLAAMAAMVITGHTARRIIPPIRGQQKKIACVGNSTTYGYGIFGWPWRSYPHVLSILLGKEYHVANFGLSSHCVQNSADKPYRSKSIFTKSIAYRPDILILMMGANDAKKENWRGIHTFQKDYLALLNAYLQGSPTVEVFLCTLTYPHPKSDGTVSFQIRTEAVAEISSMIRSLASEKGYHLLDINALTADHPDWFQADGIHPNAAGAAAIAQCVAAAIKSK